MSITVAGVKAFELMAHAGVETAAKLAPLGHDALPFVRESLGSAAGALAKLTGKDAQVVIGPAVTHASKILGPLQMLERGAAAGHMPTSDALAQVDRGLNLLSHIIAGRG